jgi:hypothetical protein
MPGKLSSGSTEIRRWPSTVAANLQALWHCMQTTFFVSILYP